MDRKSFKGHCQESVQNGIPGFHSGKEDLLTADNEQKYVKGSAKKKKVKTSQPYSPEKMGSSDGKFKEKKKKSFNLEDSAYASSSSPKHCRNSKKSSYEEKNNEYPDLLSKMNSSDNMRKSSKQSRRTSVPNVTPELKNHSKLPISQSPSSSKAGAKVHKTDLKYRSKTPDLTGAAGYSDRRSFSAKKIKFEPYIPLFQVQQGLKRGEFIEGALRINSRNYEDAYVNSPDGKMDIYIGGMQNRNRALNGDIVVVQINPKQEWKVLCDAIKDYQEKCGKKFVDTVCEPITPTTPCQVHTPDPFVRPRPLSSNSWDNACSERYPDTLEILGIDKLAKQFESISVKNKAQSKSKNKRKTKNPKLTKGSGSQKSSTASYSQDSSEDCLDRISPGQFSDKDIKGLNMKDPENQSNPLPENVSVSSQDFPNDPNYPHSNLSEVNECSIETSKDSKDNKWIETEDSVNIIISPGDLLHFDGNSILNSSNFQELDADDGSSSDVDGIVVAPGDLSGDEFTDSASIDSSFSENIDQVIEDAEFLACQQDAENNNADLAPVPVQNVNNFTGFNSVVSFQTPAITSEVSSLDAQCKIQYNKSVSPIATFNENSDVICLSISEEPVNNIEGNILEQVPITEFEISPFTKDNNNQIEPNVNIKKSRHRKRKKKNNAAKNKSLNDEINELVKAFNDIHNLTVDQVMQHPEWQRFVQKTGKVVHILERKHSCLAAGNLKLLPDKNVKWALFSPTDSRVPRILIPMSDCPTNFYHRPSDFSNVLFLAQIHQWDDYCTYANGRLIRELGNSCEIDVQTEGILIENGVDCEDFSEEVLACLPTQEPWIIPKEELDYRQDFRQKCVFTIDPASARDMDDAVSCELLNNGNYEIGVHIADVTFFLPEGTELDEVAKQRSTSVYLVQKVVPMLPRKLCDDLCSLSPGKDRLTFSVVWEMSPEGEIFNQWIGRSVINSCIKLSYEHAQDMIENPSRQWDESEHPTIYGGFSIYDVIKRVNELHCLAVKLRDKRFLNGALRLDQVKLEFTLNFETGLPLGFNVFVQRDSNKLIEEFMLLANMSVASKIYETFPSLSLLRRHPPPQTKPMQDIVAACENMGIILDSSTSGALQSSIAKYSGNDELSTAIVQVLMNLCSKPMNCALYFCTGVLEDTSLFSHYALNVPLYTHFTSPIRRYPDVIVHRLLGAALNYNSVPNMSAIEMQKCATHCNDKKYNAKKVSEHSAELFLAAFVRNLGSVHTKAMVVGVMDRSFDCLILDMGVIKRVYCDKLPLMKKEYKRSHGVSVLNLTWKDDLVKAGVKQTIVMFTLINVVMTCENESLQIKVGLVKPD